MKIDRQKYLTRLTDSSESQKSEQEMTDTKIDFGNIEGNLDIPDKQSSLAGKG